MPLVMGNHLRRLPEQKVSQSTAYNYSWVQQTDLLRLCGVFHCTDGIVTEFFLCTTREAFLSLPQFALSNLQYIKHETTSNHATSWEQNISNL
jgi:hypothetical protein